METRRNRKTNKQAWVQKVKFSSDDIFKYSDSVQSQKTDWWHKKRSQIHHTPTLAFIGRFPKCMRVPAVISFFICYLIKGQVIKVVCSICRLFAITISCTEWNDSICMLFYFLCFLILTISILLYTESFSNCLFFSTLVAHPYFMILSGFNSVKIFNVDSEPTWLLCMLIPAVDCWSLLFGSLLP